jgi:hypothetical protein
VYTQESMLRRERRGMTEEKSNVERPKIPIEENSQEYGESRIQSRVFASISPPLLKFCDNLLVLLLFLEKYNDYCNLGGDISLFHCAYDVIKNRLDDQKEWAKMEKGEIEKGLLAAFLPSSSFAFLDMLNQVQLRNQGFQTLNVDALLHDTRLYARIVSMKSNLAISRQVIFDTYLGKIKNFKFRDYLVQSGFREIDPPGWPPFITQRAMEFNDLNCRLE